MKRTQSLDALQLKEMFIAGANHLTANKQMIDDLNVFPVPDGDTGTNMSLTVQAAVKELQQKENVDFPTLAKGLSMGALMGARGNSGVILSQIFRGFSSIIADADRLDAAVLNEALKHATEVAYKAVIKPVEGTMLTVIRALSDAAQGAVQKNYDFEETLNYLMLKGNQALENTPELLPVLKQAGVVDAGGKGLMCILEGALSWLKGDQPMAVNIASQSIYTEREVMQLSEDDIVYPYCTEFIIRGNHLDKEKILHDLERIVGDSLVVVVQDDIAKIHMHTENPGRLLDYGISLGSLDGIKIDNMRTQFEAIHPRMEEVPIKVVEPLKNFGFVSVNAGEGLTEISRSMGVDVVIQGGQTMNPSTEEIAAGIRQVNASTVYVLPNNKNIIMAAQQTVHLVDDQEIVVLPTKSFPQGMAALIGFNPEGSVEENLEAMTEALKEVKSGEVTYAIRDTEFGGHTIREGSILGLFEGKIQLTGDDVHDVTRDLLAQMEDGEEICTIYYGEEVTQEEAQRLAGELEEKYENMEVELYYGGQPLYYYLVSLE